MVQITLERGYCMSPCGSARPGDFQGVLGICSGYPTIERLIRIFRGMGKDEVTKQEFMKDFEEWIKTQVLINEKYF